MKYTIYDASQWIKVGETNSDLEALQLRDRFMDSNPSADCVIEDENGNHFDEDWELASFVAEIAEHSNEELQPMTTKEALHTMMEWYKDGVRLPDDLTAEILAYYWNEEVETREAEKAARITAEDDRYEAEHPEVFRFRKAYEDGSSAFFDPDRVSYDLLRAGYDEQHRRIVVDALKAYSARKEG